ncbi:uncharacterized protein LOC144102310 [Amblyomma americanum]
MGNDTIYKSGDGRQAAAPVSRQAHALLDIDAIEGASSSSPASSYLQCLHHVGVSCDADAPPNRPVFSAGCGRKRGGCLSGRSGTCPCRAACCRWWTASPPIASCPQRAQHEAAAHARSDLQLQYAGGCFGLSSGSCIALCRRQWRGPRAAAQRAPAVPLSRGCEPGHRPTSQQRRDHIGLRALQRWLPRDDSSFTADGMQKLSFHHCRTHARCARSARAPATEYYAHLAAFLAKHHIASKVDMSSTVRESSGGRGDAVLSTVQYVEAVKVRKRSRVPCTSSGGGGSPLLLHSSSGCLHLSAARLTDPSPQKAAAERFEAEEPL